MMLILLFSSAIVSFLLTKLIMNYALSNKIIDYPNERSSHIMPTPRGGGISIVIVYSFLLIVSSIHYNIPLGYTLPILLSGFVVSLIGFLDDKNHVDSKIRLFLHFLSALIFILASQKLPLLTFFGLEIDFLYFGWIFQLLFIVWLLNLFNFMDGIDGLAGSESVIATSVMGLISVVVFNDISLTFLHLALSASVLGFLFWNFPPAKIFMGDVGSGFIGLMLGILILLSAQVSEALFWGWLVMLGVFIVDATYTLMSRMFLGYKLNLAHRSHAYQFASRKFHSHKRVTIYVCVINIFWLTPIAILISITDIDGFFALIISYIPLIILAIKFKAGKSE